MFIPASFQRDSGLQLPVPSNDDNLPNPNDDRFLTSLFQKAGIREHQLGMELRVGSKSL